MTPRTSRLLEPILQAIRTEHRTLARIVSGLSELDLARRSGAPGWTIADVLAHLGCGAEVGRARIMAAITDTEAPVDVDAIWSR